VFLILTPLTQFEVINLFGISAPILGNLNILLTNISLNTILIIIIVISLHCYGNNDSKIIPNNWSIFLETSFASICSMVRSQIGSQSEKYLPFIYSLFFFLIIGNLISNVPYSFAVTSSGIVTLGLSITIFIGVTILALRLHGINFFSFFIPKGTPLILVRAPYEG
jgi:F-type H+-transporting ATPase subunit a